MNQPLKWILSRVAELIAAKFTGSITLNFHQGSISKKLEVRHFETAAY